MNLGPLDRFKILHFLLALFLLNSCAGIDLHPSQLPPRNRQNSHVVQLPPDSGFVQKSSDATALKILFVGNSISYRHKLYSLFDSLATRSAHPKALTVGYVMGNNYYLRDHWDAGVAARFIQDKRPWDYVILQEHSSAETQYPEFMLRYVTAFTHVARRSKAEPILFETYRLQLADQDMRQESLTMQQKIAKAAGLRILPIAEVWNTLLQQTRIPLYQPNEQNHPTLKGTYLMACVLYTFLFHEPATDLPTSFESKNPHQGIVKIFEDNDEAKVLQEAALKVVH